MSQGVRKGSLFSLIGYGFAGLFLVLFHAFAGRWLGVEYYGLLNTLLSYINIATAIIASGVTECLSRYIPFYEAKSDKEREIGTIQTSFFIYLILFSVVFISSFLLKRPILKNHFNNNIAILYQFLLGTGFFSLFRLYSGLLKGYRKFDIFSIGNVIQAFMMFSFLFVFIKIIGLNEISAGWSLTASAVIAIIFYQISLRNISFQIFKARKLFNRDIIKFTLAATFILLMNIWIFRAGPILLKTLGKSEGDKLAGLFSATVMPLNFARLIVMSLQTGLFPNLSRAYSIKDNELIKRYIFKSFGIIIGIITLVLLVYYLFGPRIILLIYKKEEFLVSRTDTTLLAFAYSFYFLGLHLTKILMARNTPGYSSLSLAIGIAGMFVVLKWFELPPMRLVGTSLLVCNLLYFTIQGLFLLFVKTKKHKKNPNI